MQVQNVPEYLEIMEIRQLSEKSLDIQEHLKNNLENNRVPNDFDYFMMESVSCRVQPINFHGKSLGWISVECGTPL